MISVIRPDKRLRQISISKTPGEWEVIQQKVSELSKNGLASYITNEICKIKRKFDECPKCIAPAGNGKSKVKRPLISLIVYEDMKIIAHHMHVDVSTAIDELIIEPLLKKEY